MTESGKDTLEYLRDVDTADVFKAGHPAATLTRTERGVEFTYLPQWLSAQGQAIATTLPLASAPILTVGGGLPSYFTGLLPEGRRLGALRRAIKTSSDDELSLLLGVGADAIGDVQVVPAGVTPAEVQPRISLEGAEEVRFVDLLAELGIRAQRVALPGVQDKTSAAMINVAVSRAGERHILKLNPGKEYPYLVENEAFFLSAARVSGLDVVKHRIVRDADGEPGLLVQRFDRVTVDGQPAMLAVEDGCQAMNRPPADKYRIGADRCFAALAAVCQSPALAARDLLRQLAFAYLTGNGDAHAKNFSILRGGDEEWKVSPAYDLPSSQPYGDTTMAMTIGNKGGGDFGLADFVHLGDRLGVPARAVTKSLGELTERTELWLPGLTSLPFDRGQIAQLRRVITHRRKRLSAVR